MSTGTAASYGHPKLNELLHTATQTPFIGQVLIQTVRDLVHPQDRIIACYAIVETSGATEEKEFTYYSVDVVLVTTAFFIRINFYPKTHMAVKKRIHQITEIKVEYPAPPMDDLADIKACARRRASSPRTCCARSGATTSSRTAPSASRWGASPPSRTSISP